MCKSSRCVRVAADAAEPRQRNHAEDKKKKTFLNSKGRVPPRKGLCVFKMSCTVLFSILNLCSKDCCSSHVSELNTDPVQIPREGRLISSFREPKDYRWKTSGIDSILRLNSWSNVNNKYNSQLCAVTPLMLEEWRTELSCRKSEGLLHSKIYLANLFSRNSLLIICRRKLLICTIPPEKRKFRVRATNPPGNNSKIRLKTCFALRLLNKVSSGGSSPPLTHLFPSIIKCWEGPCSPLYSRSKIYKAATIEPLLFWSNKCKSKNYGVLDRLRENGRSYLIGREIIFRKIGRNKFDLPRRVRKSGNTSAKPRRIDRIVGSYTVARIKLYAADNGNNVPMSYFEISIRKITKFVAEKRVERNFWDLDLRNLRACKSKCLHYRLCKVHFLTENDINKKITPRNGCKIKLKIKTRPKPAGRETNKKITTFNRMKFEFEEKEIVLCTNNSKTDMSLFWKNEIFIFPFFNFTSLPLTQFYIEGEQKVPECWIERLLHEMNFRPFLLHPFAKKGVGPIGVNYVRSSCDKDVIDRFFGAGMLTVSFKSCQDLICLPSLEDYLFPAGKGRNSKNKFGKYQTITKVNRAIYLATCKPSKFVSVYSFRDDGGGNATWHRGNEVPKTLLEKISKLFAGETLAPQRSSQLGYIFFKNEEIEHVKTSKRTFHTNFCDVRGWPIIADMTGNIYILSSNPSEYEGAEGGIPHENSTIKSRISILLRTGKRRRLILVPAGRLSFSYYQDLVKMADSVCLLILFQQGPLEASSTSSNYANERTLKRSRVSRVPLRNSYFKAVPSSSRRRRRRRSEVQGKFKQPYTVGNIFNKRNRITMWNYASRAANPGDAPPSIIYLALNENFSHSEFIPVLEREIRADSKRTINYLKFASFHLRETSLLEREFTLGFRNEKLDGNFVISEKFRILNFFAETPKSRGENSLIRNPSGIEFSLIPQTYFRRVLKSHLKDNKKCQHSLFSRPKYSLELEKIGFRLPKETIGRKINLLNAQDRSIGRKTEQFLCTEIRHAFLLQIKTKINGSNENQDNFLSNGTRSNSAFQCAHVILPFVSRDIGIKWKVKRQNQSHIHVIGCTDGEGIIQRQKVSLDSVVFRLTEIPVSLFRRQKWKDNLAAEKKKANRSLAANATPPDGANKNVVISETNSGGKKISRKHYILKIENRLCKSRIDAAKRRVREYCSHSNSRLKITLHSQLLSDSNFQEYSKQRGNKRRITSRSDDYHDSRRPESVVSLSTRFHARRNRILFLNRLRNLISLKRDSNPAIKLRKMKHVNNRERLNMIGVPSLLSFLSRPYDRNENGIYDAKIRPNEISIKINYPSNENRRKRSVTEYKDLQPYLPMKSVPVSAINRANKFQYDNENEREQILGKLKNRSNLFTRQNLSKKLRNKTKVKRDNAALGKVNLNLAKRIVVDAPPLPTLLLNRPQKTHKKNLHFIKWKSNAEEDQLAVYKNSNSSIMAERFLGRGNSFFKALFSKIKTPPTLQPPPSNPQGSPEAPSLRSFVRRSPSKRTIDRRAVIPILGLFDLTCGPHQHLGGYSEKAAANLAIRHINDMNVIPGHRLVMHVNDTKCDNGVGVDAFFHAIYTLKSRLVFLLGAACADVTESLARVTPYWNLVQLYTDLVKILDTLSGRSVKERPILVYRWKEFNCLDSVWRQGTYAIAFGSETPTLSDRASFPLFFRTVAPDSSHNDARVALLQHLRWDAVATLSESSDLYTLALNELVLPLENSNISLLATVTMDEHDDIGELLSSLKKKDCRIFFGSFSHIVTRKLFCEVYHLKMYGQDYAWLLSGHSEDRWWRDTSGTACTTFQLLEAARGSFLITSHSFNVGENISVSNMTSHEFAEEFISSTGEPLTYYVTHTYDAVWAGALALKKIAESNGKHPPMKAANWGHWGIKRHRQSLNINFSVDHTPWRNRRRSNNAYHDGLPQLLKPQFKKTLKTRLIETDRSSSSSIIESDYTSPKLASQLLHQLQNLEFQGVSGPLSFAETNRIGVTAVHQIQDEEPSLIGLYHPSTKYLDLNCPGCKNIVWPGGQIPIASRVFMTRIKTIDPVAFIIMSSLSCTGILFAVFFLIFNLTYRRLKCIKLSSPRLNNITVIGCIFVYTAVLLLGLDHATLPTSDDLPIVCTARAYLLSSGFSLAFGSMFTKTYRVHQIFIRSNSAGIVRNKLLQDTQLISLVVVLLVADVMIVSSWAAVDPMRRELHNVTVQISPVERGVLYQLQVEVCESSHRSEWLGALYVYKGLLVTVGTYMAWETRHVKIPALNDSQYIGMSVYNVVITSVIVLTTAHIIKEQITLAYVIITTLIITSTTTTLCLLFIPKILTIFRRIEGDPVIESMGLKIESKTRRLLTEDKREKFYRAEVRNRVYKREVMQLELEIVRLIRSLETIDSSSAASSVSEVVHPGQDSSVKPVRVQINAKIFEDLKRFYNFQGATKRPTKTKYLRGDDASIQRAKRDRRSRLLHRSLPSLVVTPARLSRAEEDCAPGSSTPVQADNSRSPYRKSSDCGRPIPPSPHPLQKARVVRRKLPDNLNHDSSDEGSDVREEASEKGDFRKGGKMLGDKILDLRYTLNFSTPLLHELSLFIGGRPSSRPRVSFSDVPTTHGSSASPLPLSPSGSPPSTSIPSSSSSPSGSLYFLPPYPASSLSCLEQALKDASGFHVIDPPVNFAPNYLPKFQNYQLTVPPPKQRSFSQPTIASAFCSFLKRKYRMKSPSPTNEPIGRLSPFGRCRDRASFSTDSPLSRSPVDFSNSSSDLRLNFSTLGDPESSGESTVAEYQVKDLDILCPLKFAPTARSTTHSAVVVRKVSPHRRKSMSANTKRFIAGLASGKS